MSGHSAAILTISDGVSHGSREDTSGDALAERLTGDGFDVVERRVVADEADAIAMAIRSMTQAARFVVTTGGTGFGPRDVTPEATKSVIDREAPGLVHVMLSNGLAITPMAALTRATAGSLGASLVVNLPGSPKGATENLGSIMPLVPHILDLLEGNTEH